MEENSGTSKKLRAETIISVVPVAGSATGQADRKAKRHAIGAEKTKNDPKNEQMRVIEGGARKRPPDVKDHIGQQLKAIYDDVLRQPVPARFLDLLQELASKSKAEGK
jgi:hypothetical protein